MKNILKKYLVAAVVATTLFSCGNTEKNTNSFKVGVQAGPEFKLAEIAKKVAKDSFNLDVELVTFSDYIMPNEALQQKDIDINVFQTKPYLDEQSKNRGYQFEIVGKTFVYPMAGYSKKIKNISELKPGNTIVIPNDPTNLGRALLLLQEAGLIKLKADVGLLATAQDISNNPLNLKILELEAPQLTRTLDDAQVTVAIINNNFAASSNLTAKKDGLFVEGGQSPYVNIIVSRQDNKNDKKVADFVKSYQSKAVEEAAEEQFKGGAVKGW